MDKLKIALLCNNKMAMPAMGRLVQEGVLCGVATADKDAEVVSIFRQQAAQAGVPYCRVGHNGFAAQLEQWVKDTGADVVFVMTFPWRLPAALLGVPRLGFLNFHYGLLPQMRGADPVFEAVRQRMTTAGVTVHIMDEALDTGAIVLRREVPMNPEMTYGMLSAQLAYKGAEMCGKLIAPPTGGWEATPQDESIARYWPKVGANELAVRWDTMNTAAIKAVVKACNPIAKGLPVTINNWKIGLCEVGEVNLQGDPGNIKPGTIVVADVQNGLIVYCCDGMGLRLEVVYTEEGHFPGYKLAFFGISVGMMFV